MKERMAQLLTKADVCMKMDHCGEGSQGQESFHVWLDDLEFDGIELRQLEGQVPQRSAM